MQKKGIKKVKRKQQKGGELNRPKPRTVDKILEGAAKFLTFNVNLNLSRQLLFCSVHRGSSQVLGSDEYSRVEFHMDYSQHLSLEGNGLHD